MRLSTRVFSLMHQSNKPQSIKDRAKEKKSRRFPLPLPSPPCSFHRILPSAPTVHRAVLLSAFSCGHVAAFTPCGRYKFLRKADFPCTAWGNVVAGLKIPTYVLVSGVQTRWACASSVCARLYNQNELMTRPLSLLLLLLRFFKLPTLVRPTI